MNKIFLFMHCNTSSQQTNFSDVIKSLGLTPKPRANALMIYSGIKWIRSVKRPVSTSPFSSDVFPIVLRSSPDAPNIAFCK